MKAAVVPAVSSSWQIKDVPQPQPDPGQVIKIIGSQQNGRWFRAENQPKLESIWRNQAIALKTPGKAR
jgi:hypothetical protein